MIDCFSQESQENQVWMKQSKVLVELEKLNTSTIKLSVVSGVCIGSNKPQVERGKICHERPSTWQWLRVCPHKHDKVEIFDFKINYYLGKPQYG